MGADLAVGNLSSIEPGMRIEQASSDRASVA